MGKKFPIDQEMTHEEIARRIRDEWPPIVKWELRPTIMLAKQVFVSRADADEWSEEEAILAGSAIGIANNALDAAEAWRPWAICPYHNDNNVHAGCDLCQVAYDARKALKTLDVYKKSE